MGRWLISFSIFIVLTVFGKTHAQSFKTEKGNVEFLSKASLSEFTGKSSDLNGLIDLEKNLLDFFIDLNTLKTGIGLRDRHMRENYLETKKFPFAEFTGQINSPVELTKGQSIKVTATGKFKIHGIEREIEVPGMLTLSDENSIQLDATFKILLSDYQISIPTIVFYELAEEQIITINAQLKK
ncbi:Polyisoprenoid-binding protein YceI [Aquiflexum balticum DSM 16537]|uniref:Polyisoprenoid-binding protein YceI n=1 Tax=Aquiflexum balticum DSM 16537 TaxID=758820 RepID=A0A1W2H9R3_9BACT|nr:YceI family protein [Aquiflexum balticum]SMD45296.1 Polyisoprenoid-binding protein YceI [Aquiflexum balticum DSM 16537]